MKKIIAMILALCLTLALVACGSDDAGNTPDPQPAAAEYTLTC